MSYIGRGIDQIDNISTLDNLTFNGSDATFNLTQNSVAFVPVSADALQIQIDGVIQSGNYTVSGSTVTFDFVPSGSSVCNGIRHFGVGVLTVPSDGSVNMAQLGASGTKDATTFLRGDNSFVTISSTTINNNADNRVITGSGTANTLEGEANMTFDGEVLKVLGNPTTVIGQPYNLQLENDTDGATSGDAKTGILFRASYNDTTPTDMAGITAGKENTSNGEYGSFISLNTRTNGVNTIAQRLIVDSSGRVNINTASAITGEGVLQVSGNSSQNLSAWRVATNGNVGLRFFNSSTQGVGGITINASSTVYATSSDYRLKENEVAISDGIERLKQLKPYKFNFKTEPDTTVDGFFAHEVSSVVPEAVSGEKDATETYTDDNGDEQTRINSQGIDQSKLVPLLTSALQEAITKIETLETENTDIKARLTALENA